MDKPTKSDIKKWCEALRSGKYSQTRGTLQDSNGHCCFGVACEIFAPDYKRDSNGYLVGAFSIVEHNAPKWLGYIAIGFYNIGGKSFYALNDQMNFTFDEIADVLEAVYIHEVLA